MRNVRQVLFAILAALLSSAILLGALVVSLAEQGRTTALLPGSTEAATQPPPATPRPGEPTFTPTFTVQPSPAPTLPPPTGCIPPSGWQPVTVQADDTLNSLAQAYGTTPDLLAQQNCLFTSMLMAGTTLYVPVPPPTFTATPIPVQPTVIPTQAPAATSTRVPCGPPYGWILGYRVQPGDTLYRISVIYGTTVPMLQAANCLGSSVVIRTGQMLWVPNVLPQLPTLTPTRTLVPPTLTRTPVPPTAVPTTAVPPVITPTLVPRPTTAVPPTATNTEVPPTATYTEVPTATSTPPPPPPTATDTPAAVTLPTETPETPAATR